MIWLRARRIDSVAVSEIAPAVEAIECPVQESKRFVVYNGTNVDKKESVIPFTSVLFLITRGRAIFLVLMDV